MGWVGLAGGEGGKPLSMLRHLFSHFRALSPLSRGLSSKDTTWSAQLPHICQLVQLVGKKLKVGTAEKFQSSFGREEDKQQVKTAAWIPLLYLTISIEPTE